MHDKVQILLVDREPEILHTLTAILEINGYAVVPAQSSREAKRELKARRFDIVITDMRLETEAAGYEVIRAARA
jgi:DNA-binding response OmpR family regulator